VLRRSERPLATNETQFDQSRQGTSKRCRGFFKARGNLGNAIAPPPDQRENGSRLRRLSEILEQKAAGLGMQTAQRIEHKLLYRFIIRAVLARLEKPATSLARPLSRLIELGLVRRERPFGASQHDSKKSIYRIRDPFFLFWFRYVEPNRSLLEAGKMESVSREVERNVARHHADTWETLVRACIPRLPIAGIEWGTAHRWWGGGLDKKPLEVDAVAESIDGTALLVCEVKLTADASELQSARRDLKEKAARLPFSKKYRRVIARVFAANARAGLAEDVVRAGEVLRVLT
jgi:hypothetical protein